MTFSDPLAGINAIPWADIRHAYGSATDLPSLFPALLDVNHDRHDEAWEDFWNLVMHQGTLYPATVAVVPLFIPDVTIQDSVWGFLAAAVTGNFRLEEREDSFYPSFYGASYGKVVRQVRQAVLAGLPKYLELARSEDQDTRKSAYALLAELPEALPTTLPVLRERLTLEESPEIQGQLLKVQGKLLPHASEEQRQDMVRHCLELALAPYFPLELRVAALQTVSLIDPSALPTETVGIFKNLVWDAPKRFRQAGLGYWLHDLTQLLEARPDLLRSFLAALLAHSTPGLRQRAVNDIHDYAVAWRSQRQWAVETLLNHLSTDQDREVTLEIVKKLGQSGKAGNAAVPVLLDLLDSPDKELAFEAVVALTQLDEVAALPFLLSALQTRNLKSLARLCWVLRDLDDLPAELTPAVLNVMRRLREGDFEEEPQDEFSFLNSQAEVWGGYIYLNRKIKGHEGEVARELTETMRVADDFQVLDPCAEELGRRQVREAVPVLLERLQHIEENDPHTYAAVFKALAAIGDVRALKPLLTLWPVSLPDHFRWQVEIPFLNAIASLGDQSALNRVIGPPSTNELNSFKEAVLRWRVSGQDPIEMVKLLDDTEQSEKWRWPMLEELLPFIPDDSAVAGRVIAMLDRFNEERRNSPLWDRLNIALALKRFTGSEEPLMALADDFNQLRPVPHAPAFEAIMQFPELVKYAQPALVRFAHDEKFQLGGYGQNAIAEDECLQDWATQQLAGLNPAR